MMSLDRPGQTITFYSYKGGTGRTMGLANVACLLAQRDSGSQGVLMVDWDLEAPALHHYFYNEFERQFPDADRRSLVLRDHPGLIDLFLELDALTRTPGWTDGGQDEDIAVKLFNEVNIERFMLETDIPSLYLLKAGRFDEKYASRVNTFDWEELYTRVPWLIRSFAERLVQQYQYVLIDSRTGLTDTSGICTMLMPEKLVVVFTPNRQSLTGIVGLVQQATSYRKQSDDLRPLVVFPLVSRIEPAKPVLRKLWRYGDPERGIAGYQPQFEEIFEEVYALPKCDLEDYFNEVLIQHWPAYAYGEEIAVLAEGQSGLALARRYESFTNRLINLIGPWEYQAPPLSEETRRKLGPESQNLIELRRLLTTHFDRAGLRELCSDLSVDYDNLPGAGLEDQVRELIAYLSRRNRIPELIELGKQLRPDVAWDDVHKVLVVPGRRTLSPDRHLFGTCPYQGLAAFTEADAEFFFGREMLVAHLVDRLRGNPRFLAVVGPSGSGKSSVVQAGLFPALRQGEVPGSVDWHLLTFRPGVDPFVALSVAGLDTSQHSDLQAAARAFLMAHPYAKRLVLFADQFEELYTLCPEPVQERFLGQLLHLLESDLPVTVILALRADFYAYLLGYSSVLDWLKVGQVNIPPMGPEELRDAVERPALGAGLYFEPGLVETIVKDAGETKHPLPLLESALTQLWQRREEGSLTLAAYKAIGGVGGSIGQWAEDTYSGLTAEERSLARRVLTRLVYCSEGNGPNARQQRSLSELVTVAEEREAVRRLVQRLADARILVTTRDLRTMQESVEIAHDALLWEWGRLRHWVTEQREFYLWRQRLDERLREWEEKEEDEGALLRGELLGEARRWLAERSDDLHHMEKQYIHRSVALCEQERTATIRLFALAGLIILVAFGITLGTVYATQYTTIACKLWPRERWCPQNDQVMERMTVSALAGCTDGTLFAGAKDGIYRLAPRDDQWKQERALDGGVLELMTTPDCEHVYAATPNRGILRRYDGLWSQISDEEMERARAITWSENVLLVGGDFGVRYSEVGRNQAWTQPKTPIGGPVFDLVRSDGQVYAAIWGGGVWHCNENNLEQWWPLNDGLDTLYALTAIGSPIEGGPRFVGVNNGFYQWNNTRNQWQRSPEPWGNTRAFCFVIDGATAYAGQENNGVLRSIDGGLTWEQMNTGWRTPPFRVTTLIIQSDKDGRQWLYAGTSEGVWRYLLRERGFCNGDFEDNFACWQHGGELDQAVECDERGCYAILGNPTYSCEGGVPVGEAWIKQSFRVPETISPTLSLRYQVFSYDLDNLDFFQLSIKGTPLGQFGNTEWNESDCSREVWDSGWQYVEFDLSPYRGEMVEVSLRSINGTHKWWNTWTYIDYVKVR